MVKVENGSITPLQFLSSVSHHLDSVFDIATQDNDPHEAENNLFDILDPLPLQLEDEKIQNNNAGDTNQCIILAHEITDRAKLLLCRHANLCYLCAQMVNMQDKKCPTCRANI